ncbi:hypothetical protein QBC47DRAFT_362159 [Echria macrotheca]|uniref:Uncharacterized protein n=1 Tax=Echria macrotheca TaxID=438768 RepID=A0AAJ0B9J0_9PEZI|nr:hypothetical protein QBC47DRAFT_362159 [Echria macrotheca]
MGIHIFFRYRPYVNSLKWSQPRVEQVLGSTKLIRNIMAAGSIPKKSLTAAEKELTRKRLELAIKRLETQEDKVSQNKRTRLIEIKEGPDDNLEQAEDLMEGIQFDNDSGTESNPLPADGNGNNPPPADNNGNNQPPANSNGNNPPPADNNGNNPPPADNNGNNQPPANGNGNNPPPVNGTGNNPPNGTGNSPPPADDPKGGEKHHIFKSIEDEEELFVAQDHQETKSTSPGKNI